MRNEVDSLIHRWSSSPVCEGRDPRQLLTFWREIKTNYSASGRHYHTLEHLAAMFDHFEESQEQWEDPEVVSLAIFYHDIIYKPQRKDNELRSAELARERLTKLGMKSARIERCYQHILATKSHTPAVDDQDQQLLMDIDLGILAADWARYELYTQQIRREYAMYPGFLYRRGRKKVLHHFLQKDQIYQTVAFQKNYEKRARENILRELDIIS